MVPPGPPPFVRSRPVKPFSVPALVARIRALLRRVALDRGRHGLRDGAGVAGQRPARAGHGPLVLDTAGFTASLGGEPVTLTRREFELLALLVGSPGRTFTRDFRPTFWERSRSSNWHLHLTFGTHSATVATRGFLTNTRLRRQ